MNRRGFLQSVAAMAFAPQIPADAAGQLLVFEYGDTLTHWDTGVILPDGPVLMATDWTYVEEPLVIVDLTASRNPG